MILFSIVMEAIARCSSCKKQQDLVLPFVCIYWAASHSKIMLRGSPFQGAEGAKLRPRAEVG